MKSRATGFCLLLVILTFPARGQELHLAASGGDLDTVKRLVADKTNLEQLDQNQRTALHWAASKGHPRLSTCCSRPAPPSIQGCQRAHATDSRDRGWPSGNRRIASRQRRRSKPRRSQRVYGNAHRGGRGMGDAGASGRERRGHEAKTEDGAAPIHMAAGEGQSEIVTYLLGKGSM